MKTEKAAFAAHLFWTDFIYRACLQTGVTMDAARASQWINWLATVNTDHFEKRGSKLVLQALTLVLGDLEDHDGSHYATFLNRCNGRDKWYQRWTQLLLLVVQSDAVDEVGQSIIDSGITKDTQNTLQAFLWSTKGLEC